MEKVLGDKLFKQFQYVILGKEQQVLNVVLTPAQSIYVDEERVICCSEGLIKIKVKKPLWGDPLEYLFTLLLSVLDTLQRTGNSPTLLPPLPT